MSPLGRVGLDLLAWGAIQAGAGYLVHRLPLRLFGTDTWLWRKRAFEEGFYRHFLAVRRWKHLLPDAGSVFAGGFARRHLAGRDRAYLERFVSETRRAELNHWLALAATPVFAFWNPPVAMPVMAAYAVTVNVPCIVAQRYNRIRLVRVLGCRPSGVSVVEAL